MNRQIRSGSSHHTSIRCPKCQTITFGRAHKCLKCGMSLAPARRSAKAGSGNSMASYTKAGSDVLVGRVLDSKYELLECCGVGGMGRVYRARRIRIGDKVAVKVLDPGCKN